MCLRERMNSCRWVCSLQASREKHSLLCNLERYLCFCGSLLHIIHRDIYDFFSDAYFYSQSFRNCIVNKEPFDIIIQGRI